MAQVPCRHSGSPERQRQDRTQSSYSVEDEYEVDEVVLYEEAPYFGHAPTAIREGDFRVGSVNVDNLTKYKGSEKDERIF